MKKINAPQSLCVVVSWTRLFPAVKSWKIPSLSFSPGNIDLNTGSLSLWSSPLSVAELGFRAQALRSCLRVHGPGLVWVEEMSHSHTFWELPQRPGAFTKLMKEQHLPHQLQDARYIFFYLETLSFGVLKGIYFSKNVHAVEKHFFYWDESYV